MSPWSVSSLSANAANVLCEGGIFFSWGLLVRRCWSFSRNTEFVSWLGWLRLAGLFLGEVTVFHVVSGEGGLGFVLDFLGIWVREDSAGVVFFLVLGGRVRWGVLGGEAWSVSMSSLGVVVCSRLLSWVGGFPFWWFVCVP